VQIYSCDNYFILGVRSLIEKLDISNSSGMIVFDAGSEYVYIFHGDKLRHADINDSFSALVYCSHAFLSKNATLNAYSWNREPKPVSFVPKGSQSDLAELDAVISKLRPRDQSEFDALENKSVEQDKEKLPFQEKLAEFISRREQ